MTVRSIVFPCRLYKAWRTMPAMDVYQIKSSDIETYIESYYINNNFYDVPRIRAKYGEPLSTFYYELR